MTQEFKPLSYSTHYKISTECPAKTKKYLPELDDYIAEGLSGFKTLKLIQQNELQIHKVKDLNRINYIQKGNI